MQAGLQSGRNGLPLAADATSIRLTARVRVKIRVRVIRLLQPAQTPTLAHLLPCLLPCTLPCLLPCTEESLPSSCPEMAFRASLLPIRGAPAEKLPAPRCPLLLVDLADRASADLSHIKPMGHHQHAGS